jgi:hypothetical protein
MHTFARVCAIAILGFTSPPLEGQGPIVVPAGGDLQAALDRARPGQAVLLEPGATYVGNFVLPAPPKGGESRGYVTLATAPGTARLPGPGQRITPALASALARLKSPNSSAALRTAPGARYWRLELLEFLPNPGGFAEIIQLGDGSSAQQTLASVPHHLVVDRCYVHGDPDQGQKRGIALNSADTAILGSYISDIKAAGQESQAIAGWNGPGPYVIENNYIEAAGVNVLFGGAEPSIPQLVPKEISFRWNHVAKVPAWRGSRWQVKNLFELKNGRDVVVEHNLFEYNWTAAQPGYAILFTPRSSGTAPWTVVEDVLFRFNVVRHAAAAVNILGRDNNGPTEQTARIRIVQNLFDGIDGRAWGGNGEFLLIGQGPSAVTIEHNTILQTGNILSAYGRSGGQVEPIGDFVFRDNVVRHNTYGVHGQDAGVGADTLRTYFPAAVFTNNVIAGGKASLYPPGNVFVGADELPAQFVDFGAADYRPSADGRLRGAASDGGDAGVDFTRLMRGLTVTDQERARSRDLAPRPTARKRR